MTNNENANPTRTLASRIGHTLLHILLVVLAATAAVALGGTQAQAGAPAPTASVAAPAPTGGPDDVITLDYGQVSDAMWDRLREQGYTGVRGDGAERLYVPREVAVDSCYTDTDCRTAERALATEFERDNVEERAALGGCETVGLVTNEDLSCTRGA